MAVEDVIVVFNIPSSVGGRSLRQSSLEIGFAVEDCSRVDQAWASFFYEHNIPFSVACSTTFKHAVKEMSVLQRRYVPPSYHDHRERLFNEKKEELQVRLHARSITLIESFGSTLAVDRWRSITNRPLINIMQICPMEEEFISSVDTSSATKNAEYIAEVMGKYVEKVGPENMVQICMDNAHVMKKAAEIFKVKWPHLFFHGCKAHVINLLLSDSRKAD